jgi:hypothetical protein
MKKSKNTHQYEFCYRALPVIFHADPSIFIEYLKKDGTNFLRFWWEKAGENIEEDKIAPSTGLSYVLREPDKDTTIIYITLPKPNVTPDPYFLALVYQPKKKFFLTNKGGTRVIALEARVDSKGLDYTRFSEWTPRGSRVEIGPGTTPQLDTFSEAISKFVVKK